MSRKTFEIEAFKKYVNSQLERTDDFANNTGFKSGLCVALEEVLHKANRYEGYSNLFWIEGGSEEWMRNGKTELWENKKLYILGDKNSKYKGDEYARRYY